MPPRRQKPKPQNVTESVYGPARLWDRLGQIAAENDRSKSELVVGILQEWLEAFEREQQQKRR